MLYSIAVLIHMATVGGKGLTGVGIPDDRWASAETKPKLDESVEEWDRDEVGVQFTGVAAVK